MCIIQQNIHAGNFAAGDQNPFPSVYSFQSPLTASHASNTNLLVRLRSVPVQADNLLFQHAEGFAKEIFAVDFLRIDALWREAQFVVGLKHFILHYLSAKPLLNRWILRLVAHHFIFILSMDRLPCTADSYFPISYPITSLPHWTHLYSPKSKSMG
jgi:hypothetical protein